MTFLIGVVALVSFFVATVEVKAPAVAPLNKMQTIVRSTLFVNVENKYSGSAVVISPTTAISAAHVCLEGEVRVFDFSRQQRKIDRIVYGSPYSADICIIKGDFSGLPFIPIVDNTYFAINKRVFITGFPRGMYRLTGATAIAISYIQAIFPDRRLAQYYGITLDKDCLPGTSGGGIISEEMKYLGVVTLHDTIEQQCIAIPAATIKLFAIDKGVEL